MKLKRAIQAIICVCTHAHACMMCICMQRLISGVFPSLSVSQFLAHWTWAKGLGGLAGQWVPEIFHLHIPSSGVIRVATPGSLPGCKELSSDLRASITKALPWYLPVLSNNNIKSQTVWHSVILDRGTSKDALFWSIPKNDCKKTGKALVFWHETLVSVRAEKKSRKVCVCSKITGVHHVPWNLSWGVLAFVGICMNDVTCKAKYFWGDFTGAVPLNTATNALGYNTFDFWLLGVLLLPDFLCTCIYSHDSTW